MRRIVALSLASSLAATLLAADVSIVERRELDAKGSVAARKGKPNHGRRARLAARASGVRKLIDAQGLQYVFDTNVTTSTASSASGAASDATYTQAVNATTSGGGTAPAVLSDAFDGYNTLCISVNNTVAQCNVDDPNFVIYYNNGPATTECRGAASGVDRQVVLNPQQIGNVRVSRKVFVPDNDQFARWLDVFTNTGSSPQTVTIVISSNLGSDAGTRIVSSSNGDASADLTDTWVSTFQDYTAGTSPDPRLGHVLQGPAAPVPLAGIHFADGDDLPFWGYTFTLDPGETKIIANFVTGQPSKAAANAKAAELAALPPNALQCLSPAERAEIVNFALPLAVPTLSTAGLAALGLLLATAALLHLRRRAAI